jgi:hypothetical protein
MITDTDINNLKEDERRMLNCIRKSFDKLFKIDENMIDGVLHIGLPSPSTDSHLDIFFDKNDIVLSIGEWIHSHPESTDELIQSIKKIIDEKIIIWKVTRPDGYWYSGHYDIDEWKENINMIDEPDAYIEKGDRIERSTFKKMIEDKIIK